MPDGATQFKCCPPIREHANQDELWSALRDGVIDLIVTDHSPSTIDLKHLDSGDFGTAWGGVASLQLGLAAVWTEAHRRGVGLVDVVRWMARNSADNVGLVDRGRISLGARADLVVFAPEQEFTVDVTRLAHKNPVSAYEGKQLRGVVRGTWLAGARIDVNEDPRGQLIRRP